MFCVCYEYFLKQTFSVFSLLDDIKASWALFLEEQ